MDTKPSIRLKFSDAAPPPPAKVTKPKPKSPTIGAESIVVKCGHSIPFDLYAKDPYRDGRRAKASSRDCPACRQAREAVVVAAAAERKAKMKVAKEAALKPRLPDGSRFSATYDAAATQWTGILMIDGATFESRAGSLKRLLHRLDDVYRAYLVGAAASS